MKELIKSLLIKINYLEFAKNNLELTSDELLEVEKTQGYYIKQKELLEGLLNKRKVNELVA